MKIKETLTIMLILIACGKIPDRIDIVYTDATAGSNSEPEKPTDLGSCRNSKLLGTWSNYINFSSGTYSLVFTENCTLSVPYCGFLAELLYNDTPAGVLTFTGHSASQSLECFNGTVQCSYGIAGYRNSRLSLNCQNYESFQSREFVKEGF